MDFFQSIDYESIFATYGKNLLTSLAVLVIGRILGSFVLRGFDKIFKRSGMDDTLSRFIHGILKAVLIVVVLILALDMLGINTTSLVAVLGAAGLAVGLALKDSLSNFASGVMLVIFRPFKKGDFVDTAGITASVEVIGIFSTSFITADNKQIVVPNSKIYGSVITNFSKMDTRRVDITVDISYSSSIHRAKELLDEIAKSNDKILTDPAPFIAVSELATSSIKLVLRTWVKSEDFWDVKFNTLEQIKLTFDKHGIEIPFNQLQIHTSK
ncbi:MAG: mechanosensitive ion channel [Candidatus Delongbacteria bacterium]|nr:mechanosensitive ion channel [Candidatus Delongbacteria bacterium]MBN2835433.1 mechanosensitive ion channel [Candidatus Delongbacteria bacterium]